jgi:hypothetical protein
MHPRVLNFAVGTSLLTASLVTAGCSKNHTVNVKPPEEPHVNEGPEPEAPEPEAPESDSSETDGPDVTNDEPEPVPEPDGPNVNTRAPE